MSNPAAPMPNYNGFWSWFAEHQSEILEIMGGRRGGKVTDMIDDGLKGNHLSFTYEVTEGVFGGELTFTPEGDPQVARILDRFVAQAPSFDTWMIHSRRQKKSLKAALAFTKALCGVDVEDARLLVRKLDDEYHLRFIHPKLSALDEDTRYTAVATLLDHALGEAITMNYIGSIDFKSEGEGIDLALVINQIIRETGEMMGALSTGDLEQLTENGAL